MTAAEAALLGVVQGLTEFIPISSKTHLIVVPALFGIDPPPLAFIAMLHLGTLAALLVYFGRELFGIVTDLGRPGSEGRRMTALLALATIPAAVVGFTFEETFERLLSHPRGVAFSLLATAVILLAAEWAAGTVGGKRRLLRPLRSAVLTKDAIGIGLAQAVALLPGVSRSGSTLSAGLALGLRRDAAARFSFLLAIPAIAGANVLEFPEVLREGFGVVELVGFATALISGYAAVAVLLAYLRRYTLLPFAGYCLVFAVGSGLVLG